VRRAGFLFGGDGVDLETPVERGANFGRIEEDAPADFVDREISTRDPFIECARRWSGFVAVREKDSATGIDSDQLAFLLVCAHDEHLVAA
jgi:hypothetical protein